MIRWTYGLKQALVMAIYTCVVIAGTSSASADKPKMGVAEFTNEVTGMHWWSNPNVGWELSGMLTNELAATGSFSMVERSKLEHVLNEQNLAASGRIAPRTGSKMGRLVGAEYMVMGTVTAFEENTKGTDGVVGFRGISLGGSKGECYIAVDLRVVNTTKGTIDFVRSVEARAKKLGLNVGVYRGGFSGTLARTKKTPVGKAIRAMVIEISDYLECAMVKQDGCLSEFDAKEEKRKKTLRERLKLD